MSDILIVDDDFGLVSDAAIKMSAIRDSVILVSGASVRRVNVGTVGHVDHGKASLSAAIKSSLADGGRRNKSDRKRDRANRWR